MRACTGRLALTKYLVLSVLCVFVGGCVCVHMIIVTHVALKPGARKWIGGKTAGCVVHTRFGPIICIAQQLCPRASLAHKYTSTHTHTHTRTPRISMHAFASGPAAERHPSILTVRSPIRRQKTRSAFNPIAGDARARATCRMMNSSCAAATHMTNRTRPYSQHSTAQCGNVLHTHTFRAQ